MSELDEDVNCESTNIHEFYKDDGWEAIRRNISCGRPLYRKHLEIARLAHGHPPVDVRDVILEYERGKRPWAVGRPPKAAFTIQHFRALLVYEDFHEEEKAKERVRGDLTPSERAFERIGSQLACSSEKVRDLLFPQRHKNRKRKTL